MSDEENRPLPPDLQARLEQETPAEREELARVWHLLEQGRPAVDPPDADETWQDLDAQLDADGASERRTSPPPATNHRATNRRAVDRTARRRSATQWRRWAVAVAVIGGIVAGALLWRQPVRMSAPPGASTVVSLPDGSTAQLNSGTTLAYRRGFDWLPFLSSERRAVTLRGEAFFDVIEGVRPFVVETFNARIEVLGTRFNVRARPEAPVRETQVTLTAGRVQVAATSLSGRSAGNAVTLAAPGQTSHVRGTTALPTAPQDTSTQRVLAWRRQGFAVSNQSLSAIFARLERRYDVRLTLHARAAADESMTLFYSEQTDVETILHDICVAKGLNYRATSQGYEIFRKAPAGTK